MSCLRFLLSLIRGALISINMVVLGGLYILIAFFFGYKAAAYSGLPWLWGRVFCFIVSSRLVVKGKKNIPKGGGVVFLFSHSSYMDIPALFGSETGLINFVVSAFLLKYPILGSIIKTVKSVVISDDREESIKQYKAAEERLKNGDRFMVSPEGGRSNGEEVLPFKSGPFIFAMNSKATLVPVFIYGTHKIWPKADKLPNFRRLFGTFYVEYMPEVSTKDFTDENRKEKAEAIRQDMIKKLTYYQNLES